MSTRKRTDSLDEEVRATIAGNEEAIIVWAQIFRELRANGEKSVRAYIEGECENRQRRIESVLSECHNNVPRSKA